jgi:hypothetical protein
MEPGMVHLFNVKNMCKGCGRKQPSYGLKGGKATHCSGCSTDEMVDLVSNLCSTPDCYKNATKGFPGQKATRCKDHEEPGMITTRVRKCASCNLFSVEKKGGLCSYCKPNSTAKQRTKEMKVVKYIEDCKIEFTHNKSVGFSCGNYRPDIRIDVGTHIVIVEIDEDQHKQYDSKCEVARMLNIQQAEGMRCVFIRYNPDTYKIAGKTFKVYEKMRHRVLEKQIRQHMENIPEEDITVYRLFYDYDKREDISKYDINHEAEMLFNQSV